MLPLHPGRLPLVVSSLLGFVLFSGDKPDGTKTARAADDAPSAASQSKPAGAQASVTHPFVAGFDRLYAAKANATDVAGGLLLLGELNCASCHVAEGQAAMQIDAKQAPLLGEVAARANPKHLRQFILDAHGTYLPVHLRQSGGRPDAAGDQEPDDRR